MTGFRYGQQAESEDEDALRAMHGRVGQNFTRFSLIVCVCLIATFSTAARPDGPTETPSGGFLTASRFRSSEVQSVAASGAPAEGQSTGTLRNQQHRALRRFERAIARVQPLLDRYGYGAAFVAVMVEGMGIPTPGQTLLMASALEAAVGRMNIALVLILVTIAATVGNSVGYVVGRWCGRVVLDKLRVDPQRQQRLDDLFKRRGGLLIVFGRFIDGLRQLNGIVAGIMRMPWWIFTAYNVGGAVLWTCSWGLGTYYLGRDIHLLAAFFHRHGRLLYVLSLIALVVLLTYLLRARRVRNDEARVTKQG